MSNSLTRLFYNSKIITNQKIIITDKEKIHHLLGVLRIRTGENVLLFNSEDGEFLCEVLDINKHSLTVSPKKQTRLPQENKKINIAAAIIKPERFRFLLEKCTEIGCTSFSPIITARTIIKKINNNKATSYIMGATEQCGRCDVPSLLNECSLKDFLKNTQDIIIFCDEQSSPQPIQSLKLLNTLPISILVGPEGGFTNEERSLITHHQNVQRVSLGSNILRAETAAIVALSLVINK